MRAHGHTHLITSSSQSSGVRRHSDCRAEIANLRARSPGVGMNGRGLEVGRARPPRCIATVHTAQVSHTRTHTHLGLLIGVLSFSIAEEALA